MKAWLFAAEPTPSQRILRKASLRPRQGQDESTVFTNPGVETVHEKFLMEFLTASISIWSYSDRDMTCGGDLFSRLHNEILRPVSFQ